MTDRSDQSDQSSWIDRIEQLPLAPQPPPGRVVVLSAHPDDEVLAIGAWLATQADRELVFVTASDGEASHPDSAVVTPDDLRTLRPTELIAALRSLGVTQPQVQRLRLPDGGLADDPASLAAALAPWVDGAGLVLAPFEHDGHPDHDAVGAAALAACAGATPVWRFPIWTWAWTTPADQAWLASAHRLPDTSQARAAKAAALDDFVTQVHPLGDAPAVVTPELLGHALHAPEVVLT